ncbi:hypothetical protein STEG23_020046, partial [Scotinomys teguina]
DERDSGSDSLTEAAIPCCDPSPLTSPLFPPLITSSLPVKVVRVSLKLLWLLYLSGEFAENHTELTPSPLHKRAERQTRTMDSAQYAEFCESRQLSFSKKASKFRDWLDCGSMEIKPNVIAMEILAYLAYETVAQLVDLALLVRQDMVSKAGDPFSHAISATFIQYHNTAEGSCLKSCPDSPENTPPPTPTAPSSGSQHSGRATSGSLGNGGPGQDSTKSKQRKRKKSTAACGVEAHSDAIQPCHIREAIRRYGHKIGPLSPFTDRFLNSLELTKWPRVAENSPS